VAKQLWTKFILTLQSGSKSLTLYQASRRLTIMAFYYSRGASEVTSKSNRQFITARYISSNGTNLLAHDLADFYWTVLKAISNINVKGRMFQHIHYYTAQLFLTGPSC
jgi:hypothetical protein